MKRDVLVLSASNLFWDLVLVLDHTVLPLLSWPPFFLTPFPISQDYLVQFG